jgi:hypothetical protein
MLVLMSWRLSISRLMKASEVSAIARELMSHREVIDKQQTIADKAYQSFVGQKEKAAS